MNPLEFALKGVAEQSTLPVSPDCPCCGSLMRFDKNEFNCGSFFESDAIFETSQCLKRQRDQLQSRVDQLEKELETTIEQRDTARCNYNEIRESKRGFTGYR